MCAIFGIIGPYFPSQAKHAFSLLSHRGPDACALWEEERLFLAHNLLKINDHGIAQPVGNRQSLLSFNGEIYNYQALCQQYGLEGVSEAQLLLAMYGQKGKYFVKELLGMFAIAVYDNGKLLLYRDKFGKKPIYYLHREGFFAFASEIKALTPLLEHTELNKDALQGYLSYQAPTPPHTFYRGIDKLEAAHMLSLEHNNIEGECYYHLLDTYTEQASLEERLVDAVMLRAKNNACTLLSGGMDSAFINAVLKRRGMALPAYTLGYRGFENYDERSSAAESAALLGIEHRSIEITQNDFLESLDEVFYHLDEPLNDPAAVPLYLLMRRIANDGFNVVLSGEGSDELFLGYRHYFDYYDIEILKRLRKKEWLRKYMLSHPQEEREWMWHVRALEGKNVFYSSAEKFNDLHKKTLLNKAFRRNDSFGYLQKYRDAFEGSRYRDDETVWYSYSDLKHFLAENFLMKLDKTSMAHAVEARTPFLDEHVVETALAMPFEERFGEGKPKYALKQVAKHYLDERILKRRKKGFSNPYFEWLHQSGRLRLVLEVNRQSGIFNQSALEKIVAEAKRGRFQHHVWGIYVLSHWLKKTF